MSYPVNITIKLEKNKVDQLFRKIKVQNMQEFVNKKLVDELVSIYDVDGNGNISLAEFTNFLLSRTAKDPNEWLTVTDLKAKV